VIQPNDTLDTIGQRLNVSVVAIMKANNITNSRRIYAGDVIVIPEDSPAYGEFPPLENAGSSDSTLGQGGGANTTVVQPNQTLDGIAADFNVKTSCLAEANELTNPSKIFPGQMIVIDTTCPPYDGFDVVGTPTS
jgi:LysM repeat protein